VTHDSSAVARHFPFFESHPELVYLDSAATTQVLGTAIDGLMRFYGEHISVHRGSYGIGALAAEIYEGAREAVAKYVGAAGPEEIIFVRGATEAINFAAHCWGRRFLEKGDRVVVSVMEHHSNYLPWQRAAKDVGAEFCVCPIDGNGELDLEELGRLLTGNARFVSITHASNVLGTVNPVAEIVKMAHAVGATVLIDGAKWMDSGPIDVAEIGCDFYAFSGHKMFAGTGIGVLYCRKDILQQLEPFQLGGGMVDRVTESEFICRPLPIKFEAGTQNVAGAVALQCAVEFLSKFQWAEYEKHSLHIREYLDAALGEIAGLRLLGNPRRKTSVFSVVSHRVHGHDLATALASKGICVRAGNHCAQPLCKALSILASLRASFSIYNTMEDAEKFVETLKWAIGRLS
jgi:cysteine desulfurase/selenocysteine lyase